MLDAVRTVSPVDGSLYLERPFTPLAEALGKFVQARKAQAEWRLVPLAERIARVGRMIDRLVAERDIIGHELTWQMGRPLSQTPGEIDGMALRARHMMAIAPSALADLVPDAALGGGKRRIRREPVGVVLAISPWNYPYLTTINVLVPALLSGNAVVLKPSPQTPLAGERLAKAAEGILPDALVQCLHLSPEVTLELIARGPLDHVAFTGSVANGRLVEKAAAGRFLGVGLELGGKDPAYVRADADLEKAVEGLVDGAFFNAGQSCCSIERIFVERDCHDSFVDAFVELTRRYVLGNPLDRATTLGPVVGVEAAERIQGEIALAVRDGARALISAGEFPAATAGTAYMAPQVLTGCRQDMGIVQNETFGPVVAILPVDGDDQAVAMMNDSAYGLTASLWTGDDDAAWQLADRLDTGTVFLNRCDVLDPALVWGGVKDTGRGGTLSTLGFDAFTRPKSFNFNVSA